MAIKKVCDSGEFWGAKYSSCSYELDPEPGEIYEFMVEEIENGLEFIPDEIEYKTHKCLNEECSEWIDMVFFINPFDYLTKEEIYDLEKLLETIYPENDEEE